MIVILDSENLDLANEIKYELDLLGISHFIISDVDDVRSKCRLVNKNYISDKDAIFISVKECNETSISVSNNANSSSKKLASLIATEFKIMNKLLDVSDPVHDYKKSNYSVLSKTSVPSILLKFSEIDNISKIITRGICDYYKIPYIQI